MTQWAESAEVDSIDIEGYILYMDDGHHGVFTSVYNGTGYPLTRSFLVSGLTSGLPYRFQLSAVNINGESARSTITTIYACLKPSNVSAPVMTSTTKQSVAIAWDEPKSNGCAITGFTILRNSGTGDEPSITVDAGVTQSLSSLRSYNVTGLSPVSATFYIKIRAHNYAGTTDSDPLVIVLAAVPDTPTDQVTSDALVTNEQIIKVTYGPLASS